MPAKELLVSPPGTGKTAHCIELFKDQILKSRAGIGSRAFFVLPSREHAGRIQSLILKKDIPGLFNAHILTIQDLADRLPVVSAKGRPTDAVRRAVVIEALGAREESGESLYGYFREALGLRGFEELALEAIREFKAGLLSIAEFEKRAQPLLKDPVFRSKFRDFSILLKRYDAKLEELGLAEPDDRLARLDALDASDEGPELVIFDGFFFFTRSQKKLLGLVADWAERTIVTLTLDPSNAAGVDLFGYPERTRRFLLEAGFREKSDLKENHRTVDPALRHLAAHLFSPGASRFKGPAESLLFRHGRRGSGTPRPGQAPLAVISAPSRRVEVEMIAREIRRLYRTDAVHFSDICVILRAVSGERALIESVFGEYGVPVAIHERRRLTESGLAAALYRFLKLSIDDWKREDVLHLAKSSYCRAGFELADALELERAALRENVSAGRAAWERLAAEAALPPAARVFLERLLERQKLLISAAGPHGFGAQVEAFLGSLGQSLEADVDEEAARAVASILTAGRRRYAGGQELFQAARFAEEMIAAIEGGLFSLKPRGRNRVQVYDVVMALPKEYKVVFVSDLVEKKFPLPVSEDPLFKDAERKILNGADPVLEERAWRLAGERYFFYMALTRARERIYLSHATHDSDGKPVLASFFIDEALRLFDPKAIKREEKTLSEFLPRSDEWESDRDIARGVAGLYGAGASRIAEAALKHWQAPIALARELKNWPRGERAVLRDPRVLKTLASFAGPFSASELEAFLACPFRHFARYLLRLAPPLEGREEALMGTLLHETLREYFEKLPEADRISGAHLDAHMEETLEAIFFRRFDEGPFRGEPLYRQTAWRESMRRMLRRYVRLERELSAGGRVPSHFEFEFGKDGAKALRLSDESGEILFKGSIDRVDVDPSAQDAVVIDYKRSGRNLSQKVKKGDEIQMPLYLLAVERLLGLKPAGMEHRVLKTGAREDAGLSGEALDGYLKAAEARMRTAVRRIRAGEVAVEPKECTFCEFDAVCRIETKK